MVDIPDAAMLAAARTILVLLIDVTLKSVLILAVAGICTACFRRASAAAQHLIWSLALCGVLVLPLLSATLPAWRIEALSDIPYLARADAVLHESLARSVVEEATPALSSIPETAEAPPSESSASSTTAKAAAAMPDAGQGAKLTFWQSLSNRFRAAQQVPWPVWVLVVWMGGMLVVSSRFLLGAAGVWWLAFQARPLRTPGWNQLSAEVAGHLDLRRRVRLLRSVRTAMPMTWGLLRPVVLLPVGASDWSEMRRRCVLFHEFAHVKRWDCLTQTLAHIACSVNWFNPLVWIAARQMRETREMACDDRVLDSGMRPSAYAANLLDIARSTRSTLVVPLSTLSMARPSQLESRVVSILDGKRRRGALRRLTTAMSFVLVGLLVMAVAALRPGAPAADRMASGEVVASAEAEAVASWVPAHRENAYRWTARVEPGQTVTIQGGDGPVQATPTAGRDVEIMAILDDPARLVHLHGTQTPAGAIVCIASKGCDAEEQAEQPSGEAVTFLVRVPAGVHVQATTRRGDVRAVGLRSDVTASTVDGNVLVQSSGLVRAESVRGNVDLRLGAYGEAATVDGHIHARIGKTTWDGTLPFTSTNGNIAVALPEDADTDIDLNVEAEGFLQAAIQMASTPGEGTDHFQGRLGRGGRILALHTRTGNVTITHLGASGAQQQEAVYEIHTGGTRPPRPLEYRADAGQMLRWDTRQQVEERREIVFALARDGSSRAIEAIGYVFQHDPSVKVRTTAVWALGEIGCPDATPLLLAALDDESTSVRAQAVQALEHIGDEQAIEPLSRLLLADESQLVRRRAAEALAALEARQAIAALRMALDDEDQQVRQAASRALDRFSVAPGREPRQALAEAGVSVSVRTHDLRLSVDFVKKVVESLAALDDKFQLDARTIEERLAAFARDTQFAQQFEQIGFEELRTEDLFMAHLVGVDASYVRDVQRAGYCAPLKDMARLKLAGVDGDFVRAVKERGYTELSVETLVSIRRATRSFSASTSAPDEVIYEASEASGPMH